MNVTLLYFAHLRKVAGNMTREDLSLPDGARLVDAIDEAVRRHPNLQPHRASLLTTRNRKWCPAEEPLAPGDEIGLMPPVSGG